MKKENKYLILFALIVFQFTSAMVVYDPTNWIQNAATAANTAQQLVNETEQLKISLQDIKNYNGDTGQWANIQMLLFRLGNEVQKGQSLSYNMQNLDSAYHRQFPGYVAPQDYQQSYSHWSQTTLDTLQGTLSSVSMQANQFQNEQTTLNQLSYLSKTATGRMQALQVGNMLATQEVSQLQELRQLVMTQVNAQNTYASYQVQKEASGEAATNNWVSSSSTDFPRYGEGQGFSPETVSSH